MQRADGEVAGAEVRARGTALQALGQEGAHFGQRELRSVLARFADQVVEQLLKLVPLPRLARRAGGQSIGGVSEGLGPSGHVLRAVERLDCGLQPVNQLAKAAGELDRA